jgi:aspartate aminotransferase-like enzyme
MGLDLFAKEHYAWGLTCFVLPAGLSAPSVIRAAAERHGAVFAGGQDHMSGSMVRIAHMGWVDWADMLGALHALADAIRICGGYVPGNPYLEEALAAYHAALEAPLGTE